MVKWYLVLYILGQGSAITTIPTPYSTEQECKEAAKNWNGSYYNQKYICIKVVVDNYKGAVCQPGASVCQMVK